jgi:hypothetical protein
MINSLYVSSTYLLFIRRYCMTKVGIYSTSWWWANKRSKHVEAINRNKLKANSASCWSRYSDILWCTVNETLNLYKLLVSFSRCTLKKTAFGSMTLYILWNMYWSFRGVSCLHEGSLLSGLIEAAVSSEVSVPDYVASQTILHFERLPVAWY